MCNDSFSECAWVVLPLPGTLISHMVIVTLAKKIVQVVIRFRLQMALVILMKE